MRLQRIFISSLICFFLASAPNSGRAEDIDIYLRSPAIERDDAANVMIILDNSSSMPGNVVTSTSPYNPATPYTYAGAGTAFDPAKIYWKRTDSSNSQPAEPTSATTYANQNFVVGKNRCKSAGLPWAGSTTATGTSGYAELRAVMRGATSGNWTGMTATTNVDVECKPDHDDGEADVGPTPGATGFSDAMWIKAGSRDYTSVASEKFDWISGGTNVTLYSGNYLNYRNAGAATTVTETRLTVAKRVVKQILDANPGVKFGLMLFNQNGNSGPDGGYVAMRIGRLSEGVTYLTIPDFPRIDAMKDIIDNINPRPFPNDSQRNTSPNEYTATESCNPNNSTRTSACFDTSTLPTNSTPLTETMWEAKQYFSGLAPTYGYPSPKPVPPADPDAKGTDNKYISPFAFNCQKGYVIYLTDGAPTNDTAANTLIGNLNPSAGPFTGSRLNELAKWMSTQDLIPDNVLAEKQQVNTFTIGFDLNDQSAVDLLTETANQSGGEFHSASNAEQLQNKLQTILTEVSQTNTSFIAPTLSVNAYNRLFNRDEVYYALFKPSATVAWNGNVKKFKLKPDHVGDTPTCKFGDVIDSNNVCALDASQKRIKDTAVSFWGTNVADGLDVTRGGAGAEIPLPSARNVYTTLTTNTPVRIAAVAGNPVYEAAIADPTILGLPISATAAQVANLINWMLGQDVYDEDKDNNTTEKRWAHGDPLHSRPVAITYGSTAATPPEQIIKLFYGGNDGAIRMINEYNGAEDWAFIPKEILNRQYSLSQDAAGGKIYGVDGTPSFWIHDANNDGIIQPATDWVRMFINMRRGGSNIYAFDVSPDTDPLTTLTTDGGIRPNLMWVIRGGVDPDYKKLAQSWSKVSVADIRFGTATAGESIAKTVLVFGGGYDVGEDDVMPVQAAATATTKVGNAIYIVDPTNGSRLWWASDGPDSAGVAPTLALPKMKFGIPSELALFDTNGDGEKDRIFVGDTGGQLWRIDLGSTLGSTVAGGSNGGTVGYRFADIGCEGGNVINDRPNCKATGAETLDSNRRKYFYPPDVSLAIDNTFSSVPRYHLVAIATGDREDPLDLLTPPSATLDRVHNRVYAFRDVNIDSLQGQPTASLPAPLTDAVLFDATSNILQTPGTTAYDNALSDFKAKKGWFVDLKEIGTTAPANAPTGWPWVGEKSLARVLIFDNVLFVTTYVPASQLTAQTTCVANEGEGRGYELNYLSATAVYDRNNDGNYTASDRSYSLGGGIPSEPVKVIRQEGASTLIDDYQPDGPPSNVRFKTFWYQK